MHLLTINCNITASEAVFVSFRPGLSFGRGLYQRRDFPRWKYPRNVWRVCSGEWGGGIFWELVDENVLEKCVEGCQRWVTAPCRIASLYVQALWFVPPWV